MTPEEIRREIDRLVAEFEPPDPETQPELADYRDYLGTKLWARIRKRVLRRDGQLCRRCGGPGRQVHHRSYDADVLRGEQIEPLVTICDGCHEVVERDSQGYKRDMTDKDRVLFDLSEGVDLPEPQVDRKGEPIPPAGLHRATAVQARIWWRCANARAARVRARRALGRPGSSVRQRHPRTPAVTLAPAGAEADADIFLEEARFREQPHAGRGWLVGVATSPEDLARIEIDFGQRRRVALLHALAGTWAFRARVPTAAVAFPTTGSLRLISADGARVLARQDFQVASP